MIDAALALEEGEWSEPIETTNGAVLFQVAERKTFDRTQFEEEKEESRRGEEVQQVNQLMASVVELRRRDLAPTYDPDVFARFDIEPAGSPGS